MADTENQKTDETKDEKPAAPPWGDNFDAERAWNLITNLRAEKETLKGELATERTKSQALEAGESDGLKELRTRAEDAEARAKTAEHALTLSKVLRDFPALEGFEDLLTGDDEAAIRSKAERLAAIGGKAPGADDNKDGGQEEEKKDDDEPGEQKADELPGLPQPNLTPGHGGEEKAPFDPEAIAKAARSASTF